MKKKISLSIVLLVSFVLIVSVNLGFIANAPSPGWDVILTASMEGYSDASDFGVRSDATEGFDTAYDLVDPPEPPMGVVSYFWYPDNPTMFQKLTRSKIPPSPPMTWTYRVHPVNIGDGTMLINWSASEIAQIPAEYSVNLQCPDDSMINMRETTEYSFPAVSCTTYTFTIQVGTISNLYLVVRGGNNGIYYRIYSSGDSWGSWKVLPGATIDSPAAVVCNNELHIVVRGLIPNSLWHGYVNLADGTFIGWTWLDGWTPSAPTLTSNGTVLYLVVRGGDNRIYYRNYSFSPRGWEDWNVVPDGATCDSPAAAVLGTDLHLVVRGFSATEVSGNNTLWSGIVNLVDDSFLGWNRVEGWTPSAPRLSSSETLNKLYLTVRGGDDRIWINTWDGAAWEGWTALPDGTTCDSPAITVANGELHIVVRGISGTALWHYYINLSTETHSGWMRIDGWTTSPPTLTS